MADQKITDLTTGSAFKASSWIEAVEGGANVKFSPAQTDPFRGTFVGTTAFPSTGGRFTGGAPAAGDRWVVITNPIIVGGNVYPPGTVVEAIVNSAGATTLTDWIKYATQL